MCVRLPSEVGWVAPQRQGLFWGGTLILQNCMESSPHVSLPDTEIGNPEVPAEVLMACSVILLKSDMSLWSGCRAIHIPAILKSGALSLACFFPPHITL